MMKDRIQEMRNMLNVVGSPSVGGPTLGTFHRPAEKLNVDEVAKLGYSLAKLGYSLDVAAQAIGADIRNKELSAANVKEILYDLKSMKTQLDSIIKAVGKYPGPVNEGSTLKKTKVDERKSLKESAKKGEMVSFTSGRVTWYMTYVDSSHIKLNDTPNTNIGSAMYHMGQLIKEPYYADMVNWMNTGNTKRINGKKYLKIP